MMCYLHGAKVARENSSESIEKHLNHITFKKTYIIGLISYLDTSKEARPLKKLSVSSITIHEGNVDIDSVADPARKASILAQINNFGQTPKQLFLKPHVKRRSDIRRPHPLKHSTYLVPRDLRKSSSSIVQIVHVNDKILVAGPNNLLKPRSYTEYVAWGFPDRSLRFISYDQDKVLSTHENLHG